MRYTVSGNARPYASSRYKYESNPFAKFERPEGEPGVVKGTLVTMLGLVGVAAVAAALVGLRPEPASGLGHPATIANAGESK